MVLVSHNMDPIDNETSLVIADYKWLPTNRQTIFQSVLEQEEGIARVYFIAEVQLLTALVNNNSNNHNHNHNHSDYSSIRNSNFTDNIPNPLQEKNEKEEELMTQSAVILLTWKSLYICDTEANVLRFISLININRVGVIRDVWLWLRLTHSILPTNSCYSYSSLLFSPLSFRERSQSQEHLKHENSDKIDIVFSIIPNNSSPLAVQRVFLSVLSTVLLNTLSNTIHLQSSISSEISLVLGRTTGSNFVHFYPNFNLIQIPRYTHNSNNTNNNSNINNIYKKEVKKDNTKFLPSTSPFFLSNFPLLRYKRLWKDVTNPHVLISHLLLRHQITCGRPPAIPYDILKDNSAKWSPAALEERQRRIKEEEKEKEELQQLQNISSSVSNSSLYSHIPSVSFVPTIALPSQIVKKVEEKKKSLSEDNNNNNKKQEELPLRSPRVVEKKLTSPAARQLFNAVEEVLITSEEKEKRRIKNESGIVMSSSPRAPVNDDCMNETFPIAAYSSSLSHSSSTNNNNINNNKEIKEDETKKEIVGYDKSRIHNKTLDSSSSAVLWDPFIERMLHRNGRNEPADTNYARKITKDILLNIKVSQRPCGPNEVYTPRVLERCVLNSSPSCPKNSSITTASAVIPNNNNNSNNNNNNESYRILTTAVPFKVCPPLRM